MAAIYPFVFVPKTDRQEKITVELETDFWTRVYDNVNDLIARTNAFQASSIDEINIIWHGSEKETTIAEYDANITAIENAFNSIIVKSEAIGFNPNNKITLFKRSVLQRPLLTYERDTNCGTIQVFINTAHILMQWAGY
ncbi:MAG: hypothetical protein EOL90_12865 [Spartobacteria bacterium]|nr:hypothetical protein [Spartobacteria bacterium]